MRRFSFVAVALLVALLAGGWLLSSAVTMADDAKEPVRYRGQLYRNWGKLNLSDGQKQKIYKIQFEHRGKIAALEAQIRELKKQERGLAEMVLTPAQKERLREILLEKAPDKPTTKPLPGKPTTKPLPGKLETDKKPSVKKD